MYMGLMVLSRKTEIHTAQLLEHEPSAFEVAMAIDKLKGQKITRYLSNPSRID